MDLFDDFSSDSLAFGLLEEDLSGDSSPQVTATQPPPSTDPSIQRGPKRLLFTAPQPPSAGSALLSTVKNSSTGIAAIQQASNGEENPSIPINTHYVEITNDHRALAEELQKYTCPPLDLLDKGANAFLTLVTGTQYGEPYRRRKDSESTSEEDEDETVTFPRVELFTYDGDDGTSKKKMKKKGREIVGFGPGSDERSHKLMNRLFPIPDMGESPFLKQMKMMKTNCANVVYMEHLEAMNERIEALERQLEATQPPLSPAPVTKPAESSTAPSSAKSDDFEVVGRSDTDKSPSELQSALTEANERIAEAEKLRDQMADKYNNLVATISESLMKAAR